MKNILKLSIFACFLLALGAQAQALTIDPAYTTPLDFGNETSQDEIDKIIAPQISPAEILYKSNFDDGVEEWALSGSYETTYSNFADTENFTDPSDALIEYTGGFIVGSPAYLLVKDGAASPAWYLFDLTALEWDGMEDLVLTNFWPGDATGAISHVSLYGTKTAPVPEPTTLLLLGSGLAGLAAVKRRKSL